jgi:hypothetical protein
LARLCGFGLKGKIKGKNYKNSLSKKSTNKKKKKANQKKNNMYK